MRFDYEFSNLCGSVYKQGNVIFTPDGNSILSPVGNRVTVVDLLKNQSFTFPFEGRKNITRIAISPDSNLLLTVDEDGYALLVNFHRRIVLHHFRFKGKVSALKFSPDGKYFCCAIGKHVQVWRTPGMHLEFAPFVLHRTYTGHHDDVVSVDWSADGRWFVTGARDFTCRVYSLMKEKGFSPVTLAGHRDVVLGAFFAKSGETIFSVSRDGACIEWNVRIETTESKSAERESSSEDSSEEDEGGTKYIWSQAQKSYFHQEHGTKVSSVSFFESSNLLVTGFSNGVFGLYELPELNNIHTLSISQKRIATVAINSTGEWLAFGAPKLGQLLVWEWQSETYILKQQGHSLEMNDMDYSPDGQLIVTGGDDHKVKVWNTSSGFCFVTFSEHTGPVTAVCFTKAGNAVYSSSLDGTVRAFDLTRYRNFRTLTATKPTQFFSLAVDGTGEVVAAGSLDTFEIFLWSMQTGKLLEVLSGHEAPVSELSFSPTNSMLSSASWDRTVKLWEVFEGKGHIETLDAQSDVLAVAFRPDGKEVASATLNGQISFWEPTSGTLLGTIDGRWDVMGGRKSTDRTTAQNSSAGKCFNSLSYTADGKCIIAGGNSKFVCIYEVATKVVLRKFQISHNRSLDGVLDKLNSSRMTEAGGLDEIDGSSGSDGEDRADLSLPGVRKGDMSSRRVKPAVRSKGVKFSPNGRAWGAVSTEGLLIYSLDEELHFDPSDLEMDVTPAAVNEALSKQDYSKALVMAFKLNERPIIQKVYYSIPHEQADVLVRSLPLQILPGILTFVAGEMHESSPHIELNLRWIRVLLHAHGHHVKHNSSTFLPALRFLAKSISRQRESLQTICNENKYGLDYLISIPQDSTIDDTMDKDMDKDMEEDPFLERALGGDSEGEWEQPTDDTHGPARTQTLAGKSSPQLSPKLASVKRRGDEDVTRAPKARKTGTSEKRKRSSQKAQ